MNFVTNRMSRTIAGLLVAGAASIGLTISEHLAVELVLLVIDLAGLGYAYHARQSRGDLKPSGVRKVRHAV